MSTCGPGGRWRGLAVVALGIFFGIVFLHRLKETKMAPVSAPAEDLTLPQISRSEPEEAARVEARARALMEEWRGWYEKTRKHDAKLLQDKLSQVNRALSLQKQESDALRRAIPGDGTSCWAAVLHAATVGLDYRASPFALVSLKEELAETKKTTLSRTHGWVRPCTWQDCARQSLTDASARVLSTVNATAAWVSSEPRRAVVVSGDGAAGRRAGSEGVQRAKKVCESEVFRASISSFPEDALERWFLPESSSSLCSKTTRGRTIESIATVLDKSLDAVVFDLDEYCEHLLREDPTAEDLERLSEHLFTAIAAWFSRLRAGGVMMGTNYAVKDFTVRDAAEPDARATARAYAIKAAIDRFRLGDENEFGQDDDVFVASEGLWYFYRRKVKIFG